MKGKWLPLGLVLVFLLWTPVFSQVKIGVFDSMRVSEETEAGKKYAQDLERTRNAKLVEIDAKQKEIQDLQSQLSTQELSLSAEKRDGMLKDIQKKNVEIQRLKDDAGRELQSAYMEAEKKFQSEMLKVVEVIGTEQGYSLIFEKSQCVYSSGMIDITSQVIERFNLSYLERQKQQAPPAPPQAKPQTSQPEAKK